MNAHLYVLHAFKTDKREVKWMLNLKTQDLLNSSQTLLPTELLGPDGSGMYRIRLCTLIRNYLKPSWLLYFSILVMLGLNCTVMLCAACVHSHGRYPPSSLGLTDGNKWCWISIHCPFHFSLAVLNTCLIQPGLYSIKCHMQYKCMYI